MSAISSSPTSVAATMRRSGSRTAMRWLPATACEAVTIRPSAPEITKPAPMRSATRPAPTRRRASGFCSSAAEYSRPTPNTPTAADRPCRRAGAKLVGGMRGGSASGAFGWAHDVSSADAPAAASAAAPTVRRQRPFAPLTRPEAADRGRS